MEIKLNVPTYNPQNGIEYNWEKNFVIETKYENGAVTIFANKEGLISLANHLLNLAQETIPPNYHLHFDDLNSLEDGSIELIIQKIK
ncbi:MAG: hypothetical protein BGO14_00795 [Chlamydiales bacterium 38-26]|nr:hypothetical protein [Chlamydiales bacterium]OJV07260.1 MAG: hypothetical protein BGO14_00795 [Chlamydiales bacterium 38-26]